MLFELIDGELWDESENNIQENILNNKEDESIKEFQLEIQEKNILNYKEDESMKEFQSEIQEKNILNYKEDESIKEFQSETILTNKAQENDILKYQHIKEQARLRQKKYYDANKDKVLEKKKEKRIEYREYIQSKNIVDK
jgi:hypothetical protein